MKPVKSMAMFLTLTSIAACSGESQPPDTGDASRAPAQQAAPATVANVADAQATGLERSPAPANAEVFFVAPQQGAVVSGPVKVEFGVTGMDVVPAGQQAEHSGHHHVLVNTGLPDLAWPIPADEQHIHFGDGSSSTELLLAPGEHTLQLLFADHLHLPHDPPVFSEVITITVE
ncbi:MAG: DUF4399 domain-containing protein [Woeseia sp.]